MPEEEVDDIVDSILTDTDDTQPEEPDSAEEAPETPEKAQIEKRLRDTQAALHELATKNARLEGQLEALSNQPPPTQAPEDIEKIKEALREDPSKAIELMEERENRLRQELASVLAGQEQKNKRMAMEANPAHELISKKVEALSRDPDFKDFSEDQLYVLAKKSMKKVARMPGPPGGRAAETVKTPPKEVEVDPDAYAQLIQGAGYNVEESK